MEQLTDWVSFYNSHLEQVEEIRMSFHHGLAMAASFACFALFMSRCIKGPKVDRLQPQEDWKPRPFLAVYWWLMLLYYFVVFGLLLWVHFTFHLKLTLFPVAYTSLLTAASVLVPSVLFILLVVRFERNVVPKELGDETPKRQPGMWVFEGKTRGQLVPLIVVGFFGFMIINGGIFGIATYVISAPWEYHYVVKGKVLSRYIIQRRRIHQIKLEVQDARLLTYKGLGNKIIHPKKMEFQTTSKIYKQVGGKTVVLFATMDHAVALVRILRTNGSDREGRAPRQSSARRRP